jgi:hypothetical protein
MKITFGNTILSAVLVLGAATASAQDGITVTSETDIQTQAGGLSGCVQNRTTRDFVTDAAAKAYSDQQAYDDQMTSALVCGLMAAALPGAKPLIAAVAGLGCAAVAVDYRAELRKSDRIVERLSACVAGGVGGTVIHDARFAIGKRDGKTVLLYAIESIGDPARLKAMAEEELARY